METIPLKKEKIVSFMLLRQCCILYCPIAFTLVQTLLEDGIREWHVNTPWMKTVHTHSNKIGYNLLTDDLSHPAFPNLGYKRWFSLEQRQIKFCTQREMMMNSE